MPITIHRSLSTLFCCSTPWAKEGSERGPVTPQQEKKEKDDNDGERQSLARQEKVEDDNIENDRAQNREPERDEPANEQEQSADDLAAGDHIDVSAGEKSVEEFADDPLRQGRHRKKLEKAVHPEDDKDKAEQEPNNNGSDFHRALMARNDQRGNAV